MVNLKKIFKNKLIDFYIKNINLFDIQSLSNNTSIPIEIIEMLPEYNWNWNYLSSNENINIDFIVKFKDKSFNWNNLTIHQNILFKMITMILYRRYYQRYMPLQNYFHHHHHLQH